MIPNQLSTEKVGQIPIVQLENANNMDGHDQRGAPIPRVQRPLNRRCLTRSRKAISTTATTTDTSENDVKMRRDAMEVQHLEQSKLEPANESLSNETFIFKLAELLEGPLKPFIVVSPDEIIKVTRDYLERKAIEQEEHQSAISEFFRSLSPKSQLSQFLQISQGTSLPHGQPCQGNTSESVYHPNQVEARGPYNEIFMESERKKYLAQWMEDPTNEANPFKKLIDMTSIIMIEILNSVVDKIPNVARFVRDWEEKCGKSIKQMWITIENSSGDRTDDHTIVQKEIKEVPILAEMLGQKSHEVCFRRLSQLKQFWFLKTGESTGWSPIIYQARVINDLLLEIKCND